MSIVRAGEVAHQNSPGEIIIHGYRILWLAWREARPIVQIIFLSRFLAGAVIAADTVGNIPWKSVGVTAACWLATTTTVYLINGISDIAEDSVNDSPRPIASGKLSLPAATTVAAGSAAAALAGGVLVGNEMTVLLTVAMLSVGYAYSMGRHPLKKHMGGFLCSVVAGGMLTYLAGWSSVGGPAIHLDLVLFGIAMSLWMGFGGATKDLSDIEGDRFAGRRSWPVVLGERRARLVMAVTAVATGTAFAVAALVAAPTLLPPATMLLTGSVLLAVTAHSHNRKGRRNPRRAPYKVFMATQYAVHFALFAQFTL